MITSKQTILKNINSELSDNSTGEISPRDIRHNLIDVVDSVNNLLDGKKVDLLDFGTPDNRNVRVGNESLKSLKLSGYTSSDNTAVGYGTLRSSYRTKQNTAVGAYALSCNVHGEDDVAIGYNSLAGNTTGFSNVGIGNYALNYNKTGHGNVAIGHGAGYYAPKDDGYKFYLASHPVDEDYLCDNPNGSTLVPLLYGDFSNNRIGIATRTLHNQGVLQASGDINPSTDGVFNVGHPSYRWGQVNTTLLRFSNKSYMRLDPSDDQTIRIRSNLLPHAANTYDIGADLSRWRKGFFDELYAQSSTFFQRLNYIHKTVYLASSGVFTIDGGGPEGVYDYFPPPTNQDAVATSFDSDLLGAGLVIRSKEDSGRDYSFTFNKSSACFSEALRSWSSNLALELSGVNPYVKGGGIYSKDSSTCYGLYYYNSQAYFSDATHFSNKGNIAGLGHVNFIDSSTNAENDYIISYVSPSGGVNVTQRFLSKSTPRNVDGNSNPILHGFATTYHEESLSNDQSRLCFSSFAGQSQPTNHFMMLANDGSKSGVFGINNFGSNGNQIVPETIFNIRSNTDARLRVTAEVDADTVSAIELFAKENCDKYGAEFKYIASSGTSDNIAELNVYKNQIRIPFMSFQDIGNVGILHSGSPDHLLTIGSTTHPNATVALHEVINRPPSGEAKYGALFVEERVSTNQSQTLMFRDDENNFHNLLRNHFNPADGLLYVEGGNTLGGMSCNSDRSKLSDAENNTGLGHQALKDITLGDCNTAIGHNALSSIGKGSYNTAIGCGSLSNVEESVSYNIAIGCSDVGKDLTTGFNFLVGYNNENILLKGVLGPAATDKKLSMPDGHLSVENSTGVESLNLKVNKVEVSDTAGNDHPDQQLSFTFTGAESHDLLLLDHSVSEMSNVPNYTDPNPLRPFAELKGDLKLQGAIRFADGSSMTGADDLKEISRLSNMLNNFIVEGNALEDIGPASEYASPSRGFIVNAAGNNFEIFNRDRYNKIKKNDFVIAIKINSEYRPIWISNESASCTCCTR